MPSKDERPASPVPTDVTASPERTPRTRSPNYPSLSLKEAVAKSRALYESPTKRHAVGIGTIADVWGNKIKSSTFKLNLAAVQYFGLLVEVPNGEDKLLKLSPLALDIIADYPSDSPEYRRSLQKAALLPKLHADLWARWKADLPPDLEIKRYLVRERSFNDTTVNAFIDEYKQTLSFAKLGNSDIVAVADDLKTFAAPAVGDLVQWTSGGADQWQVPKRVTSISDDGEYAFMEGQRSAVLVKELTVETPKPNTPVAKPDAKIPPVNQNYVPTANQLGDGRSRRLAGAKGAGIREDVFTVEDGAVVVQWPERMSSDEIEDFEGWMQIVVRKVMRTMRKADEEAKFALRKQISNRLNKNEDDELPDDE